jgi:thiosulfate/3-mercaptopyruvate sulfurtransferase
MRQRQLISPGELSLERDFENSHIVDCRFWLSDASRGRQEYASGHVPGAVFMDLNQDLASAPGATSGRHPLPDVATIAATIGNLGMDNRSNVVVYDSDNGAMAARCWWIFRWLGHENVRLLVGGLAEWIRAGLPLSVKGSAPRPAHFQANTCDRAVITSEEVAKMLGTDKMQNVFDARDANRFAGIREPIDAIAGHVPGARNLPFISSLKSNGLWKERAGLEELWQRHLGDDREVEWVAMCGSGVTACHLALSAVEAGYSAPRLYVGSWSEWIRDARRPVATGSG